MQEARNNAPDVALLCGVMGFALPLSGRPRAQEFALHDAHRCKRAAVDVRRICGHGYISSGLFHAFFLLLRVGRERAHGVPPKHPSHPAVCCAAVCAKKPALYAPVGGPGWPCRSAPVSASARTHASAQAPSLAYIARRRRGRTA